MSIYIKGIDMPKDGYGIFIDWLGNVSMIGDEIKDIPTAHAREEKTSWISLKEHLPEKREYVLARFKNNDMGVVCWFDGGKDVLLWKVMTDDGFCSDLESEPTHWMPLPDPPKED